MPRTPDLPLISLCNVSVHLNGRRALEDVCWMLQPDRHWGFSGPNGSGKSTLLRVIRGDQWIDPDGGERTYRFDGTPRGALSAGDHIGFVAPEQQERYARLDLPLFGRAVVESGLDDSLYLGRALDAAERAAVDAILERLDLVEIARRRVRALSFGQLRRLLIARALVRGPRVLILDEFTNGLDTSSRSEILALIGTLAGSVQLIVASHRSDEFVAALTDHAVLRAGRVVACGAGGPPSARPRRRPAAPALLERADAHPAALVELKRADVFRGPTRVLAAIDWSIAPGEHTAVFGPNGSGKSTFGAVVAGTLAPAYGSQLLRCGEDGPFDIWRVKTAVAHVSEEFQITYDADHRVEDVVCSGFAASVGLFHEPDAGQRARAAVLLGRLELEPLRGRRFLHLSFGERRKVLIARSLVLPPVLLILDEVWNGLDTAFRTLLEAHLYELAAAGTTLLMIAHHEEDLPALIRRRFHIENGTLRRVTGARRSPDEAQSPSRR